MKLVRNLFLVLMIATIAVACSNPQKKLAKKWQLEEIQSADTDKIPADKRKELVAMVSFEFTKEGKLIIIGLSKDPLNSDYTLSKDNKTILSKGSDGKEQNIEIKELTDEKLELSFKQGTGDATMHFVPKK